VRTLLEVEITKIDVSTREKKRTKDFVAEEKPLYVFLNRSLYTTILCTPSNLKELAIGHVLSEGVVKSIEEIEEAELNEKEGSCRIRLKESVDLEKRLKLKKHFARVIFTACGSNKPLQPSPRIAKVRSDLKVKAESVLKFVNSLNRDALTFRETGGVHAAAIYRSDGNCVAFAEDVGRHNAVDKVIGIAAMDRIVPTGCLIVLTGRLTADIVLKVARAKVPIVASLAAALSSGIALARDVDLTLVGFARGSRLNVYTFPERILV
jgi:FdhD protein